MNDLYLLLVNDILVENNIYVYKRQKERMPKYEDQVY